MLFLIGGAVVGAVIGIAGWAVDYSKRSQRYEAEVNEKEEEIAVKMTTVNTLTRDQVNVAREVNENKTKLADLKVKTKQYISKKERYRLKLSEVKERRDDVEQKENQQTMDESFKSMNF
ncbi:MAG: hypothetical protein M3R00_06975 [Pseudomonadota bacterium]|nr:hypothetical protein [Pseudomonadota bacterium]